jgi:phosphonate transport system substrate-binding protein
MKHNLRNALLLILPIIAVACGSAATPTSAPTATVAPVATAVPAEASPTVVASAAPAATDTAAPSATAAATATTQTASVDKTGWPTEFKIGLFASDDAQKVLNNSEPIRNYLEKALGIPVKVTTGTSYSAVIEAMRAKRVDAMEVGPLAYVLASKEANAQALAVAVAPVVKEGITVTYDSKLIPYYYSVIFTKKGSGIKTLADLKGKGFNFVDPASTSGHMMPKSYLINNGINPDTDLKAVFAGSHPTSVLSVWNGKAPAGATYEDNLYQLAADKQIDFCAFDKPHTRPTDDEIKARYDACPDGSIVVLAFTDPIPQTPFAVRGDLPESFKQAVTDALMGIKDNPEMIASYHQWYVNPAQSLGLKSLDNLYDGLRDVAKNLNITTAD